MATQATARYASADFADDVRSGLTDRRQKEIPSKYLYDALGSALFEAITLLPEYGLTRADQRLLERRAEAIVCPLLPGSVIVAELGSGNGKKTRSILQALAQQQHTPYYPIEISSDALSRCTSDLGQLERVDVIGLERGYLDGLALVAARRRRGERLMVLFLGSSIGNFDRPAAVHFLSDVRHSLRPGDALLLGTDLEKSEKRLLLAYDDPIGVTASFNLNLLARINRDLGANFDLTAFAHLARYNEAERRVEMHLVSKFEQNVSIPGADCSVSFRNGETIWTESSYKYTVEEVLQMGRRAGFRPEAQWLDEEWPFAETLLIAE